MLCTLVTAPLIEPVTLPDAKLHLRQDGSDDDEYITALLRAAREDVENATSRKLLTQTWDYTVNNWPSGITIKLPWGNLQSVTSVKWKDEDGTETTLTVTTDYLVTTRGTECGGITLPYGETWPTGTLYPVDAITIRYICGWTSPTLIPAPIKAAILMRLAKLYESRGEDVVGPTVVTEDKTMQNLLRNYTLWDEF